MNIQALAEMMYQNAIGEPLVDLESDFPKQDWYTKIHSLISECVPDDKQDLMLSECVRLERGMFYEGVKAGLNLNNTEIFI